MRSRLSRAGIDSPTLRDFGVGYAPGDTQLLASHLARWEYSPAELTAAGVMSASSRSYLHVLFHARIIFPMRDLGGRVRGFAGLATHLAPSWPLWLTSPDGGLFDTRSAIFGLDQSASAIALAGRALLLRDCVQVLVLHQQGRRDAVAVIQSPITRAHVARLAAVLGAGDLHLARRDGRLGVVAVPAGAELEDGAFAAQSTPAGFTLIDSERSRGRAEPAGDSPALVEEQPRPARAIVYVASAFIGVGIPIGLLLFAAPDDAASEGSTPALNLVVVGVAVAYLILALVVSRLSARFRARSKARRMREPWARGSDEWQPAGWTYHRLEEVLVGAALASAVTCLILLMTIGGFLG